MRQCWLLLCLASLLSAVAADAQWLTLPTPGLPRLPDGKPNLTAPVQRTADGRPDLSGIWSNDGGDRLYNNIAADLQPGDVAPWADAIYQKRRLEFGKDSMETRCLPMGPAVTTNRYRSVRIVQTPALIALMYDDMTHRTVFMDGRALEPDPNPTWMGYSVGRWDGDTLVVDSNGYNDRTWLDFDGHPHTEALRITERFTRRNIGRIDVQVTMTDPKTFTKPVSFSMPMKLEADREMLEYICENNKSLTSTAPARVADVPAATLSQYVGVFDVVDDGGRKTAAEVTLAGTTLWLDYASQGKEPLVALSPTMFSWSGSIVEFLPQAGGAMNLRLRFVEGDELGPRRPR